jgi:S-methylmethionine-dependent homocysteine/selenocysteine methylase
MNADLQRSLADNAKEWLALSLSISSDEKATFDKIHDRFFTTHGSNFMAHVYRITFEKALRQMPEAERTKLLVAFQDSLAEAIDEHYSTLPSSAECTACRTTLLRLFPTPLG